MSGAPPMAKRGTSPPPDARRRARVVAFYLPQFSPVPQNDAWWGPGFTEWTSVVEAPRLFRHHRQPRIPADLGFYDLRLPESRAAQADLARAHGVEGFCYWHYWFGGERLLERPFEAVLRSGEPDFGFCLGWANQAWTDTWLGTGRVLQAQHYSAEDDVAHARWVLDAFADHRYLTVDGRPLFVVYQPLDLPDPRRTADTFRSVATSAGLREPYVLGIDAFAFGRDFREVGFDGTVSYEPSLGLLPRNRGASTLARPFRKVARTAANLRRGVWSTTLKVYSYADQIRASRRARAAFRHPYYPTVFVGWDNTPRRGRAAIVMAVDEGDIRRFEAELERVVAACADRPFDDRLVFVTAWNEWAEGNYLEPDLDTGFAKLDAVARVVYGRR
jgi:hypothetical protein